MGSNLDHKILVELLILDAATWRQRAIALGVADHASGASNVIAARMSMAMHPERRPGALDQL